MINGQHRMWMAYPRGWSLLKSPHAPFVLAMLFFGTVFVVSMYVLATLPTGSGSKWDKAAAIGTCGGLPMLRLEDGSIWLRVSSVRVYKIEDVTKLTCG